MTTATLSYKGKTARMPDTPAEMRAVEKIIDERGEKMAKVMTEEDKQKVEKKLGTVAGKPKGLGKIPVIKAEKAVAGIEQIEREKSSESPKQLELDFSKRYAKVFTAERDKIVNNLLKSFAQLHLEENEVNMVIKTLAVYVPGIWVYTVEPKKK